MTLKSEKYILNYNMELPTTSNIDLLTEFQDVFNTHIRPVAEEELAHMDSSHAEAYDELREKLIPASIIVDTFLYLSMHLSEMASHQIIEAQANGDIGQLIDTCDIHDPYWKAARSLSLALKVFAQDPSKGNP